MDQFNVCITDDDVDDYFFLSQAFEKLGNQFQLKHLQNGIELFKFLFHSKKNKLSLPNLIILDFNMPLMNGLEVLKLLKKKEDFSNIPVIIYSTMNDEDQRDELFSYGANGFVTKGASLSEISSFARKVLGFLNNTQEIPGKQKIYVTLK